MRTALRLAPGWRRRLFRILGFDKGLQVGQARGPESAKLLEPGIDGAQGFRVQVIKGVASPTMLVDQMRSPQQAQVLGNGGPGDRECLGNLPGWLAAFAEQVEHCP